VAEPRKKAGGWGALASSLRFLRREGFFKGNKTLLRMNQPGGFDCPGCAWPEPRNASVTEFCENGVKALTYETTAKRATPELFARHTVTEMRAWDDFTLENTGRLTHPMAYNPQTDHYEPVGWDEVFSRIAAHLRSLDSPDEAVFYTSGRTSNEAAFLYQLLGRLYGTNNFPDCSNMCHESSGVGMREALATGKGTVSLEDFEKADAIFIFGQNPGTNHPRMLSELEKASKRGARIVAFNPLREAGLLNFTHPQHPADMIFGRSTPISSHYYQLRIGGDMAAVRAMAKSILEKAQDDPTLLDRGFLGQHTHGFEAYRDIVRATSWNCLLDQCGLTRRQIDEAAGVYLGASSVICCWAMGLTQHRHGVANVQEIVNLLLLRGNIGRPGAGPCPVRGHSNVQGDRTMGITEEPAEDFLLRLEKEFNFTAPRRRGYATVHAIKAMAEGRVKFFLGMGGNFASATPDSGYTWEALRRCPLTVQVSTHLNRSHVVHGQGALILPCLGRSEADIQASGRQSVTVEDSMSMVHASTGRNRPASEHLKSEPAIVAGIGLQLFPGGAVDWDSMVSDYDRIRERIEAVVPGFSGYNRKIRQPGGFRLRNPAAHREWNTATGRANFVSNKLPDDAPRPGRLRLTTIRSHNQYNTTVYDSGDRYRGITGERRVIFLHPADMHELGLSEQSTVTIRSHAPDGRDRRAAGFRPVVYDIPRGCAAAYYPETNVLVGLDEHAVKSFTPMSKCIEVSLEPSGPVQR
jgi:molybdopterin-dependent oxidoreductase alpha subunit